MWLTDWLTNNQRWLEFPRVNWYTPYETTEQRAETQVQLWCSSSFRLVPGGTRRIIALQYQFSILCKVTEEVDVVMQWLVVSWSLVLCLQRQGQFQAAQKIITNTIMTTQKTVLLIDGQFNFLFLILYIHTPRHLWWVANNLASDTQKN